MSAEPQVRVHIDKLDPALFATDEDRVSASSQGIEDLPGWELLRSAPPVGQKGTWMNQHHQTVDQREWVWYSMWRHTVAYRGFIPAVALDVVAPYVTADWAVAAPGASYVPGSTPAQYYVGHPQYHPA